MGGALEPAVHDRQMSRRPAAGRRELEQQIGYAFADDTLLDGALTHISALSGKNRVGSYQRLEFLGDHVLGLVVSDMLFRGFPEGGRGRAVAPARRSRAQGDLRRGRARDRSRRRHQARGLRGQCRRPQPAAILADVCEALIGAVFLDGGYQAAAAVVEQLWGERLRTPASPVRDPKTALQEWAQARGLPTPSYREVARTGPHHDPQFRVAVQLPD